MAAVDVSYRIEGQGPALYLVHGIGARKTTWDELIDGLKDRFTCVSYDLRGHGESPVPATPYTLDDMVDDLEALRQKLGHQKIHLAGHSLGGMIGPAYARAYPGHTLSVGLLIVGQMANVGDIHNLCYAVVSVLKITSEEIRQKKGGKVPDVGVTPDRRAAVVHPNDTGL